MPDDIGANTGGAGDTNIVVDGDGLSPAGLGVFVMVLGMVLEQDQGGAGLGEKRVVADG